MNHVPDMRIAQGTHGLDNAAFQGSPYVAPGFVAVAPPPTHTEPGQRPGTRKRMLGLIPAQVGALFALIVRDVPKQRVNPRDISVARAEVRRAERERAAAETTWVNSAKDAAGHGDKDLLLAARDAMDREAMLRRKLNELEGAARTGPTQVRMSRVVDPSEVPDALANPDMPARYVCMHDGCRHDRYDSEQEMRRAHPSNTEMQRLQQAHVYALLSDAPLDPLDPDGPTVGYIAPIGRDGTTIERAAASADAEHGEDERDARIEYLEAQLNEMRAMFDEMRAKKNKAT